MKAFTVNVADATGTTVSTTYSITFQSGTVYQLATGLGTIAPVTNTAGTIYSYTTTPDFSGTTPTVQVATALPYYVVALDAWGNVVSNLSFPYTVAFSLSKADTLASFSTSSTYTAGATTSSYSFTAAPGFEQLYAFFGTAVTTQAQAITVKDVSSPAVLQASTSTFSVTAATFSKLAVKVTSWGTNTTNTVTVGPNNFITFTVTAEDQFGNTTTNYGASPNFALAAPDSGAQFYTGTSTYSFGSTFAFTGLSGVATLYAFFTAPTTSTLQNIVVSDTTSIPGTTVTGSLATGFTVKAGGTLDPATKFAVSAPLTTATVGTPFAFTVTAEDQYGNTITSFGDGQLLTLKDGVTGGTGTNTTGTDYFFATQPVAGQTTGTLTSLSFAPGNTYNGVRTLYAIMTGATTAQTIAVSGDPSVTNGTSASFPVNPGTATKLLLSNEDYYSSGSYSSSYATGSPTIVAGTALQFTVSAEDSYGNITTQYATLATFKVSSPDASDTFYSADPECLWFDKQHHQSDGHDGYLHLHDGCRRRQRRAHLLCDSGQGHAARRRQCRGCSSQR